MLSALWSCDGSANVAWLNINPSQQGHASLGYEAGLVRHKPLLFMLTVFSFLSRAWTDARFLVTH